MLIHVLMTLKMYVAVNNLNLVGTEVHTPRSHIPPSMPDARVLSALLGIGFVMTHIFFNRGVDQSRPRTRGQAKIEAERERQSLNMSHVLDSWTCSWCRFENRCLRSARARRNNLECTNCRNDFICAVSPRKVAHQALLDERPVQVTCRRPVRARRVRTRDASRRR